MACVEKQQDRVKVYDNKVLLSSLPQNDSFLLVMSSVFRYARWFGVYNRSGWRSFLWCLLLLSMLLAIEAGALIKLIRAVAGMAIDTDGGRSVIARLSGSIFYANGLFSSLLSWRLACFWNKISSRWAKTERAAGPLLDPDPGLRRKLLTIAWLIGVCSCVEHSLSMMSATDFYCPPSEYLERYILSSHGFLLRADEYSLWLAIMIFISSKTATCMWNFQDCLIILISCGLTSRYKRLNAYAQEMVFQRPLGAAKLQNEDYIMYQKWRRLREAYVRQAALVRSVDNELGGLILLSNFNNFYFICLQLFLGIGGDKPSLINKFYYLLSLTWLCLRACSVVLYAADVNVHSKYALRFIQRYPEHNIEARRLEKQLAHDLVALSGKGFFYLDRNLLLQVAAAISTYELVLFQYDT